MSGAARSERIGLACLRDPPIPPMGRPHVQPLLGLHFHPSVENTPAREYEHMRAVIIDDGQFKVAVERRGGYLLPHSVKFGGQINRRIDLNHVVRGSRRRSAWRRPGRHSRAPRRLETALIWINSGAANSVFFFGHIHVARI